MTFRWRKVVFRKPDLDTCAVAFLAGIGRDTDVLVEWVRHNAPPNYLRDLGILCIGCGGTRDVDFSNFDDTVRGPENISSAAYQFWCENVPREQRTDYLQSLIEFVDFVDTRGAASLGRLPPGHISLVHIFSGLHYMLGAKAPAQKIEELYAGIEIIQEIVARNYNPRRIDVESPDFSEKWREYITQGNVTREKIHDIILDEGRVARTASGKTLAYLELGKQHANFRVMGPMSMMVEGVYVVVIRQESLGFPTAKFMITTHGAAIPRPDVLLASLVALSGRWDWVSPGYITGYSQTLALQKVVEAVQQHL